jgi:hypothetical protein
MAEDAPHSNEGLKWSASETVRLGDNIRDKVRELTLLALKQRRFDQRGIQDIVQSVAEGIALGAETSRGDMRRAISEALAGLDQALRISAEAGRLALEQLTDSSKDFSETELKSALVNLKRLEDDFLATIARVADAASERVQPELRVMLGAVRRTGTETGKHVAATMTEFAHRFSAASVDTAIASLEGANEFGQRFVQLASGILARLPETRSHAARAEEGSG